MTTPATNDDQPDEDEYADERRYTGSGCRISDLPPEERAAAREEYRRTHGRTR